MATRYQQPTRFSGQYIGGYWAGYRFKETLGYTSGKHTGVDYNYGAGNDDMGQAVRAIADGTVVYVGNKTNIGFGLTVGIRHTLTATQRKQSGGKKYAYSRYMHLQSYSVKKGQVVKVGQIIGKLGNTGTGWAHLHLDLWTDKNGLGWHLEYHKNTTLDSYLDPYKWIQAHLKDEPKPKPKPAPTPAPAPKPPTVVAPAPKPEPKPEPAPEPPKPPEVETEPKPPSPAPPRPIEPVKVDTWQTIIEFLKGVFKWRK